MDLKDKIRSIEDYPQKGVIFRDITTLLKDAEGLLKKNMARLSRSRRNPEACRADKLHILPLSAFGGYTEVL